MGADLVDDLHAAEDLIGTLRELLLASATVTTAPEWCRPSCSVECDETECGCPCHLGEGGCESCGWGADDDPQPWDGDACYVCGKAHDPTTCGWCDRCGDYHLAELDCAP